MHYDFIAILDADVPQAVEPMFQHVVTTYASDANKTVSLWRALPNHLLDFKPREKTNTIRTILVHQLLSARRSVGCSYYASATRSRAPRAEAGVSSGDQGRILRGLGGRVRGAVTLRDSA